MKILLAIKNYEIKKKLLIFSGEKINLFWLKQIALIYVGWGIFFIFNFSLLFFSPFFMKASVIFPFFTFFVLLLIGHNVCFHPERFFKTKAAKIFKTNEEIEEEKFLVTLLDFFAREKPYLIPNLSPTDLSKMMNVSVYFLSNVINKYLDKNFYDFVNGYRVEEARNKLIELINDGEIFDYLSIYNEVGFSSKAEFSKVFKTYTGMTPSQYKIRTLTLKNRDICFTVGVFLDNFYDSYEINIFSGIEQFAINNGIRVIYFDGGAINSPQYSGTSKNSVFEIARSELIDGIILMSSSLSSFVSAEEFDSFCKIYSGKPVVSVGREIKYGSSVLVDNRSGMKELLIHLIESHGYSRIAFVRGPEKNVEATERFRVYKEVLEEYNIPFDDNLVVSGMFVGDTGKKAISTLFDERRVSFDVIVASNDFVAMQIIQELAFRGKKVPEDIAVVGFDDIKGSIYFSRPLTTVHQPLFDIGYKAIKMLFEMMCERRGSSKVIFPTKLVVRETCGCVSFLNAERKILKVGKKTRKVLENLDRIRESLILEVRDLLSEQFSNVIDDKLLLEWTVDLIDSFIDDIKDLREEKFLVILDEILSEAITNRNDSDFWNFIILHIFNNVIAGLVSQKRIDFIDDLKKKAKQIIDSIRERIAGNPIMETKKMEFDFFMITQSLTTCFDFEALSDTVFKYFPRMGIKSCYVCLFENNTKNDITNYSHVLIAYEGKNRITENNFLFLTSEIVPGGVKRLSNDNKFIIESLYFYDELLGYVIYEFENKEMEIFETLTIQLSNAIKGIIEHENVGKLAETGKIKERKEFFAKYQKSRLPDEIAKRYYRKLIDCLRTEKVYKNMDFSLTELSEKLRIPRNHLSYVINEYAKSNFYDLINYYRVEEAKKLLVKNRNLSILDVAFESGFNSKSTFNNVFKKLTGQTPSEYREESLKKFY